MYFATILKIAYNASGRQEPIERFFSSILAAIMKKPAASQAAP